MPRIRKITAQKAEQHQKAVTNRNEQVHIQAIRKQNQRKYFQIAMLLNFFRKLFAHPELVPYLCFRTKRKNGMIASNHSNNVIINVLLVILEKITGER